MDSGAQNQEEGHQEPPPNDIFTRRYHVDTPFSDFNCDIDEVFKVALGVDTYLVVDAAEEHVFRGLFLMYGKELKLHVIRDGRVVRLSRYAQKHMSKTLLQMLMGATFIYPYDPTDYPDAHVVEF